MRKLCLSVIETTAYTIHPALLLKLFLLKKRGCFASLAAEEF